MKSTWDDDVTNDEAVLTHNWVCDGYRFLFKELNKQGKELDEILEIRENAFTWLKKGMNVKYMRTWERDTRSEESKWESFFIK
eukprot:SAG11_NODE_2034_length_3897_cov_168.660611_3_plen_83_part_00